MNDLDVLFRNGLFPISSFTREAEGEYNRLKKELDALFTRLMDDLKERAIGGK